MRYQGEALNEIRSLRRFGAALSCVATRLFPMEGTPPQKVKWRKFSREERVSHWGGANSAAAGRVDTFFCESRLFLVYFALSLCFIHPNGISFSC
jgi:hypothetical protein